VTDGTWLWCSCICDPDVWGSGAVWIDGALVVVVLEEVGRPSAVTAGKGSVLRKVGKADVSDMSWAERSWVVLLAGAMVSSCDVQLRCEERAVVTPGVTIRVLAGPGNVAALLLRSRGPAEYQTSNSCLHQRVVVLW
jgi:hypothetical protein